MRGRTEKGLVEPRKEQKKQKLGVNEEKDPTRKGEEEGSKGVSMEVKVLSSTKN